MSEFKTYREQLRDAMILAGKTGQRITKVFNKQRFIRDFPKFANDPRVAFTPETFRLDVTPIEAITVGELRKLCYAKGDHPLAIQFLMANDPFDDSTIVRVLRQDLDVLKQGRTPTTVVTSTAPPESTPSIAPLTAKSDVPPEDPPE